VARTLAGSCNVPLAAFGCITGQTRTLRGYVGAPDGTRTARATVEGKALDAEVLGIALAARLRDAGADDILSTLQPSRDAT